eukprot:scaffold136414_cov60-Cyclotella_meneghiniana.AAC.3
MIAYRSAFTSVLLRQASSFTSTLFPSPRKTSFNFNSATLSMTSSSCVPPVSTLLSSPIIGGDYAGFSANFCAKSGELIPVPEHLVPESMLEWGDIPSHLEVLTSENESGENVLVTRTTITVLPEVGCGIDNLETIKKENTLVSDNTQWQLYVPDEKKQIASIDQLKSAHQVELETIFQTAAEEVTDENGKTITYPRRIRISFAVDKSTRSLTSDISIQVERQLSEKSSSGIKWTGEQHNSGGLDARTVVNDIGNDIVYGDVFSVKKGKQNKDRWDYLTAMTGKWVQRNVIPVSAENEQRQVQRESSDFGITTDKNSNITVLHLPQNILLRYGNQFTLLDGSEVHDWGVELSHFDVINGQVQRNVLLRLFNDQALKIDEGKIISFIWVEDKI